MFLQYNAKVMDNLLNELLATPTRTNDYTRTMKIEDDVLSMEFDVPGLSKKDFKITIEDTTLVIDGTTESRKFFKSYKIQKDWDLAKTGAVVKNGVLKITIPKKEEKKTKLLTVDVK
jgi:HSP20 family protein